MEPGDARLPLARRTRPAGRRRALHRQQPPPGRRWRTTGTVVAAERGSEFAFDVVGGGFLAVATWRYEFTARDGGCEVTETFIDRRGPLLRAFGVLTLGIADRSEHNRRTMAETLARLKAAAERPA